MTPGRRVGDLPAGLGVHARGIADWLRAKGGIHFTPGHLRDAVAAVSPMSSGTGERPGIVHAALAELQKAEVVALSGTTDPEYPHYPTRVTLLLHRPGRSGRADSEPWHSRMSQVTTTPRSPNTTLGKANRWVFRHRSTAVPEPLRERALEITGDEKALDRPGPGIDMNMLCDVLRTYRVAVPLARRQRVGPGPILLVIENLTTFDSIGRVLRAVPGGPIGEIVWGVGGEFQSSVLSLRDDPPVAIRYFGDLDADGLRIPAAASLRAEQAGLPAVRPATGLYSLLLSHGRRQHSPPTEPARARTLAEWLDPVHRDAAVDLLTGGVRHAQEACRRSVLTTDDAWRHDPPEIP